MPATKIAVNDEAPASRADAFAELGLSPASSDDEVRDAFRLRIKAAHPDLNGGTDTLLRRLILARDLLMADTRRVAGPELLHTLANGHEPVRLDITLAQAIGGGDISAEVPALEIAAPHEELTSLTQMKRLTVPLRPGLRNGDIVSVRIDGAVRAEQPFRIHIAAGDGVRVWGEDIWMTAALEARLFAIGGSATIDTPHGAQEIALEKETAQGSSLCLKGLGLPATETHPAGDLHIRLEARAAEIKPFTEALGTFRQRWAS
ncbi:MAG: DnaJ C-terminal domain-containing protein [Asticcacaulis sp.]